MECLSEDTEILLNDGSVKKIQDLDIGDHLSSIAEPCILLTVSKLEDDLFNISYGDNGFICNSNHTLILKNEIKIQEEVCGKRRFEVSFFCPYTLRYKYHFCKTLRDAVLVKNFLVDIVGIADISVANYIASDCKLSLCANYYNVQGCSKVPFEIIYHSHGTCYILEFKNGAQRALTNK